LSTGKSFFFALHDDYTTGTATVIGNLGEHSVLAGDIAFATDGTLYGSINGNQTDYLATISTATGAATIIGEIGYDGVLGISFKDGQLFGVTYSGQLLSVDIGTGVGTLLGTDLRGTKFGGLATSTSA
jgi:hypothetical protein